MRTTDYGRTSHEVRKVKKTGVRVVDSSLHIRPISANFAISKIGTDQLDI